MEWRCGATAPQSAVCVKKAVLHRSSTLPRLATSGCKAESTVYVTCYRTSSRFKTQTFNVNASAVNTNSDLLIRTLQGMSSAFSRTLTIHSQDLGVVATLLLTFDSQQQPGLYTTYFPTAWQVAAFGASGPYAMISTYKNQLAFVKPQVSDAVLVTTSTWVDINVGQQTNLSEDSSTGIFSFSAPTAEQPPGKTFEVWNLTAAPQSMGVAFDTGKEPPPTTVLYFNPIPVGNNLTVKFTPILTAYVVTGYQQDQIIRGPIQSPAIWSKDLTDLDPATSWTFSRDPATGDFQLTQDLSTPTVHSDVIKKPQ